LLDLRTNAVKHGALSAPSGHVSISWHGAPERRTQKMLDLTAKMIPVMIETVEKFNAMGASPDHIIRFLQATIDEINRGK
jgi:two-component sensor histidine kinase